MDIPIIWKDAAQRSWDLYMKALDMPLPAVSERFEMPTITDERNSPMDVTQDHAALMPAGDFDKLDKHEKEAFSELQEEAVQHLLKASNDFARRFPGLEVEWRFQAEVYRRVTSNPGTIRYSQRVY